MKFHMHHFGIPFTWTSSVGSHEKNPALLSIESWLFDRDPYNGLLQSPHNWLGPKDVIPYILERTVFFSLLKWRGLLSLENLQWQKVEFLVGIHGTYTDPRSYKYL